jgi:hypothetical protein
LRSSFGIPATGYRENEAVYAFRDRNADLASVAAMLDPVVNEIGGCVKQVVAIADHRHNPTGVESWSRTPFPPAHPTHPRFPRSGMRSPRPLRMIALRVA